jgi:hypothetical protein
MGWKAVTIEGEILSEDMPIGRPIALVEEGTIRVIMQEDFGHKVAVDLINGIIAIDYEDFSVQNKVVELHNTKLQFWICEETTIVAELRHLERRHDPVLDENGVQKLRDGNPWFEQTDYLTSLTWRPIWFTRWTNGSPTKCIGAQTTLPELQGGRNVKKVISLFQDGRIGID